MPGSASPRLAKVLLGATVGNDVEEAQELPVNLARGRHGTLQEGIGSARSFVVPVTMQQLSER